MWCCGRAAPCAHPPPVSARAWDGMRVLVRWRGAVLLRRNPVRASSLSGCACGSWLLPWRAVVRASAARRTRMMWFGRSAERTWRRVRHRSCYPHDGCGAGGLLKTTRINSDILLCNTAVSACPRAPCLRLPSHSLPSATTVAMISFICRCKSCSCACSVSPCLRASSLHHTPSQHRTVSQAATCCYVCVRVCGCGVAIAVRVCGVPFPLCSLRPGDADMEVTSQGSLSTLGLGPQLHKLLFATMQPALQAGRGGLARGSLGSLAHTHSHTHACRVSLGRSKLPQRTRLTLLWRSASSSCIRPPASASSLDMSCRYARRSFSSSVRIASTSWRDRSRWYVTLDNSVVVLLNWEQAHTHRQRHVKARHLPCKQGGTVATHLG